MKAPVEDKCSKNGCIPIRVCFVENKDRGTVHLACCEEIMVGITSSKCICTKNLIHSRC